MKNIFSKLLSSIFLVAVIILANSAETQAQTFNISGNITEFGSSEALTGATVRLLSLADSSMVRGATTDDNGFYRLERIQPGKYRIAVTYLGFAPQAREIEITDESLTDVHFIMRAGALNLEEVRIRGVQQRVEIRGDTTAINADAYTVNQDASAEDLVRRMPGIQVQDGEVQAQGERIRRVTVDGQEFFGDDALLTLRNLPASIISEIQIFDDAGDQARFTGFNDGNTDRIMNIRTRPGMNKGSFGRGNTGLGTTEKYLLNGNYNVFNGARRISLIGLTNNINQQNFSMEDLLGVSQTANIGGGGGGGRGGAGGGFGGRGAMNDFRVGQDNGISSVHSIGVNYIDRWGENLRINGSYFFNFSDNENDHSLERRYLAGFAQDQIYDENAISTRDNFNHRMNARVEYQLDERNSFIFTPRASYQVNNSSQIMDAFTMDQTSALINQLNSENRSDNSGYNISGNLLYRNRFETRGRTISASLRTDINDRSGDRFQYDESTFYSETVNQVINDQQTETFTGGYTLSTDISYTEPVSERAQLMLSYQPSLNINSSVQDAFMFDSAQNNYARLDTSLSNRYENQVMTQRLRTSYRLRGERYNVNLNLAYQYTELNGDQTFPYVVQTNQSWQNILPGANVQYRFENRSSINISYNINTRTPSANQLQDVINNDDPLRIRAGNPDLDQQMDHRVNLRYRGANPDRGTSMAAFVSFGYTTDYIGNRTIIARQDTQLQEGIILGRGARLIAPDNIGDAYNIRSFAFRGMPIASLKSNLNLNAGASFSRTPSIIDGERNLADNISLSAGTMISSNISPEVDFRLSYRGSYSIVENSLQPELDNNYYTGRANAAANVQPWKGLVVASDVNIIHYEGLGEDFSQNIVNWNASLGYKFLENRAAEIRFTVFDILAQNNNINRNINDDYIEDYRSNVLSRYFLVSFSYNFRNFPGGNQPQQPQRRPGMMRM